MHLKRVLIGVAVLAVPSAALAQDGRSVGDPYSLTKLMRTTPSPKFSGTVLDQNFDTFTPGVFPQNDWDSNWHPTFAFSDSPAINGVSLQHTSDGSNFADTGWSPSLATSPFGRLDFDVMTSVTGAHYGLSPEPGETGGGGFINTRVLLRPDGTIDVLQAVDGAGVFFATTGSFTNGTVFRIGVETLDDGTLNVYQNGSLIFTGTEINFAMGEGPAGTGTFVLNAFNDTGSTDDFLLLDNFVTPIPEPASLALLGLAGAALLCRRRH